MFDHLSIMKEAVSIRRGEHPGWTGDPVANRDAFLARVGRDLPDDASALADDLVANTTDYSDELGISPDSVRYYANRLRDGVAQSRITAYYTDKSRPGQPAPARR